MELQEASRYFCHVDGFKDDTAFVRVYPNGCVKATTKEGVDWFYTAGNLRSFEEKTARGVWRELTRAEAEALVVPASVRTDLARRLGGMADMVLSAKVGPQARFFTRARVDEIVLLLREAEKRIIEG